MDKRKGNIIVDLTFEFSLEIIRFVELIESRLDFIHKMKIAEKLHTIDKILTKIIGTAKTKSKTIEAN